MKNPTSETSIIKDIAVFDYVAGKQSDGAVRNFEKLLENDDELAHEVEIEEQLRDALEQNHRDNASKPVSMKNLDALLERINLDEIEMGDVSTDNSTSASDASSNVIVAQPWRWQRQFNIAASFAFVAMVGVIGFNQTTEPKFTTLSNQSASAEIDFAALVEQQRLLKLDLSEGIAPTDVAELLQAYQLQSIQSGSLGQTVLVSAPQSINAAQLALLVADKRISNAELVSFGAE